MPHSTYRAFHLAKLSEMTFLSWNAAEVQSNTDPGLNCDPKLCFRTILTWKAFWKFLILLRRKYHSANEYLSFCYQQLKCTFRIFTTKLYLTFANNSSSSQPIDVVLLGAGFLSLCECLGAVRIGNFTHTG